MIDLWLQLALEQLAELEKDRGMFADLPPEAYVHIGAAKAHMELALAAITGKPPPPLKAS